MPSTKPVDGGQSTIIGLITTITEKESKRSSIPCVLNCCPHVLFRMVRLVLTAQAIVGVVLGIALFFAGR